MSAEQLPLGPAMDAGPYRLPWLRAEFVCRDGRRKAPQFNGPESVGRWCLDQLLDRPGDAREWFWILALDVRQRLIGEPYPASIGCVSQSLVHPREVFRFALVVGASGIVLAHNHPSGDPDPSADDIALTRRLAAGGTLLGVEVFDHLILGSRTGGGAGGFVSLKERGVL